MATASAWKGYGGGEIMPLRGYSALLATYGAAAAATAIGLRRRGLARRLKFSWQDVVLGGIATHKLTRIATHDWVTAPLRAPFTTFKKAKSGGEVVEKSRGGQLRRAVGDLLTCAYCSGPWIAGGLLAGLLAAPKATRAITALFTMVAVSDFLHRAYELGSARLEVQRER